MDSHILRRNLPANVKAITPDFARVDIGKQNSFAAGANMNAHAPIRHPCLGVFSDLPLVFRREWRRCRSRAT
jgi:hypothetical protein